MEFLSALGRDVEIVVRDGYPSKDRARIERQCVDAELRLARLLPDATELEEFAREKLSRKWWTEDAQRARRERTRRELG